MTLKAENSFLAFSADGRIVAALPVTAFDFSLIAKNREQDLFANTLYLHIGLANQGGASGSSVSVTRLASAVSPEIFNLFMRYGA